MYQIADALIKRLRKSDWNVSKREQEERNERVKTTAPDSSPPALFKCITHGKKKSLTLRHPRICRQRKVSTRP